MKNALTPPMALTVILVGFSAEVATRAVVVVKLEAVMLTTGVTVQGCYRALSFSPKNT